MANPYSQNGESLTGLSDLNGLGWANLGAAGIGALSGMLNGALRASGNNYLARAQARIAEKNAQMEELRANQALAASNQRISYLTMRYGQTKSRQKLGFAANGIKASSGSYAETLTTTDLYKELDIHTAYANGLAAAYGHLNRATQYRMKGAAAEASVESPLLAGGTGLLTGVAKIGTTYAKMVGAERK